MERHDEPRSSRTAPDGNDDGIELYDRSDESYHCVHGAFIPPNARGGAGLARLHCPACKQADADNWKQLHTY